MKKTLWLIFCIMLTVLTLTIGSEVNAMGTRDVLNFNTGWLYSPKDYSNAQLTLFDDSDFETVSVPHANKVLEKHKGDDFLSQIESYRFVSWYRRHFTLPEEYAGKRIIV